MKKILCLIIKKKRASPSSGPALYAKGKVKDYSSTLITSMPCQQIRSQPSWFKITLQDLGMFQ